jgi:hypothetical protein
MYQEKSDSAHMMQEIACLLTIPVHLIVTLVTIEDLKEQIGKQLVATSLQSNQKDNCLVFRVDCLKILKVC